MSWRELDSERATKMRAKRTAMEFAKRVAVEVAGRSDAEDFLHAFSHFGNVVRTKCASLFLGRDDEAEVVRIYVSNVASESGLRGFFAMRRGNHA